MFTNEFEFDATITTVMDETAEHEDVQLIISEDVVYIRQFNDEKRQTTYDLIAMTPKMFKDMVKLTQAPVKDFGTKVTDIILQEITGMDSATVTEELSTKKTNIINDLKDSLASEMDSKGKTLWGAFSGVTHYTTHKISHRASHQSQKTYGHVAKKDSKVFNRLVE